MQSQSEYGGPGVQGHSPIVSGKGGPVEGGGAQLSSPVHQGYTGIEPSLNGADYRSGPPQTLPPPALPNANPTPHFPHPALSTRPTLPQPSTASTAQMPRRTSTLPMTCRPAPHTALPISTDPAAALLVFYRQLVAYYWHYAQQGYVAPLTAAEGTDEYAQQVAARTEAVEWARQCRISVMEPPLSRVGCTSGSAMRTVSVQEEARGQGTVSRRLPLAPLSAFPPNRPDAPALPPARSAADAPPHPATSVPHVPQASSAQSASSTASPSPGPLSQAAFHGSVSSAAVSVPARGVLVHSFERIGAPPPTSASAKRPLPVPPLFTPIATLPNQPDTSDAVDRLASLSLIEGVERAEETSTAPAVPSFSFDGPDQVDERSSPPAKPPIPSFAFEGDEDPSSAHSAVPSVSFGDENVPATTWRRFDARPRPPPLHPRYDPSHPSHTLYHPTSGGHAIPEAGTIVCTACHQPIFGRVLVALGRQWHPDCFRCAEEGCGARLEVMEFEGTPEDWEDGEDTSDDEAEGARRESLQGKAWCMVHFEERFALECHHCRTPIASADYIPVSNPSLPPRSDYRHPSTRYYHPLHFFCAGCGDPFIDPVAYESRFATSPSVEARPYVPREGHPYCDSCDLRMWRPRCPGCKKGLREEDGFLEVEGAGRWHEGCFKCSRCAKPLSGVYLLRRVPGITDTDAGDEAPHELPHCAECYDVRAKEEAEAAVQR